jgi:hypothetical protein
MATRDVPIAVVQDRHVTSSDELAAFHRAASTEVAVGHPVASTAATARDVSQWPNWFPMHAGWSAEPPAALAVGTSFGQQIKVMGIPAEIEWTVARADETSVRLDGSGRVGVTMSVFLDVAVSKRIVDESPDWHTAEGYQRQSELAGPILGSADAAEGIRAFAEHRDPVWTGR